MSETVSSYRTWILLLAVSIALAGWFIGDGFVRGRTADRFVTVKGVAERDVMADLALWPLQVVGSADDLGEAQAVVERSMATVLEFLGSRGVDTALVERQGVEVTDNVLNQYGPGTPRGPRYVVALRVMVRSEEPRVIHEASQQVGDLLARGVVLRSGSGWGPTLPTFLFKGLNDLKPAMIAEATASAREAAEQFAADAGSRLGGIRRASQGVFVILPRDQAAGITEESQLFKTVRVVSTVEYTLR